MPIRSSRTRKSVLLVLTSDIYVDLIADHSLFRLRDDVGLNSQGLFYLPTLCEVSSRHIF